MKRLYLIVAAALVLFAAHASVSAKDTWTSVRSQNFHLVGNASEKDIQQVASRLEQFRHAFSRVFKRARLSDSVPTTVIVFKNPNSYKPFNPRNSAGYFQPGEDVNYITLSAETRSGADSPFSIIFHEYMHLLVKNNVSSNTPAWLNEGLAEFYSTLEVPKGEKAEIGKPIAPHVFYLREQKLLPLRTLFAVDHSSPHYNEQSKRGVFYAQSWALVHYLMLGKERRRQPQLNRYLELVGDGASQQESFEAAFGADIEVIEKELRDYIRRDTYPYVTFDLGQKLDPTATMQTTGLTEAQGLAYLGDLALHSPGLLEQAEANLQKAVALDANDAMTQASLGMLRMRQRRFAEAKEHLRRAVASDARNHLAHYYFAYTLSREGMSEMGFVSSYAPERAGEMRVALRKAIELKPDFAASYSLLAFVNMVTGEQVDESIELLKRALLLTPGEQQFQLDLAQLYLLKQDFDGARKIIEPLAASAPDARMKANAQSLLSSIKNIQEQMAQFKSSRGADGAGGETSANDGGPPRLGRRARPGETSAPDERAESSGPNTPDTDGMTVEEAMALSMREAMRKPQPGEMRARGVFTRVECNAKGAIFHIRVGEQVLKLFGGDMSGIHFMAFTQNEAGGEIGCGPRKPESQVVVTYRAKEKSGGDLVAVEFVPASFVLEK